MRTWTESAGEPCGERAPDVLGQDDSLDWLIVGGGPHGLHLALRLLGAVVPSARIRIVDPHSEPLVHSCVPKRYQL